MTSFLTGGMAGISSNSTSTSSKALRDIDSQKVSYANKDFVKNIAWLNQSVDTLAQYSQKLEQGVSQGNSNALEQIQGIFGDLFILFAGGEPTGIEIGDVKYIIQGIGAFFGINPDTPFPLNLLEAANHFLSNFLIPLEQFTDVVFDSIIAWAEDFGLSESFIDALKLLKDAIESLGEEFGDLFAAIGDLLGAFGFFGLGSTSGIGTLWDALVGLIDGIPLNLLKPVLDLLAWLGTGFINALTAIINTGTAFLGFISGDQIRELGDNVVPAPSAATTVWTVGGSYSTGWIFDPTVTASGSVAGSLTTLGNGTAKRVDTQGLFKTKSGNKLMVNAKLKWTSIPAGSNAFGLQIIWMNGSSEVSTTSINIAAGHGATGGFVALPATELEVPAGIDGFKVAAYVGSAITTGQVWVDDISVQLSGTIKKGLIQGITDFLTKLSPVNAKNLYGTAPKSLFDMIPLESIFYQPGTNYLANPVFSGPESVAGGVDWIWDGTVHYPEEVPTGGSVYVIADGQLHEIASDATGVMVGQRVEMQIAVQWGPGFVGPTDSIALVAEAWLNNEVLGEKVLIEQVVLEGVTSPGANGDWEELNGHYEVPEGANEVVMVLRVSEQATAGRVTFSDGHFGKSFVPKIVPINWVNGLEDALSGVDDFVQWVVGVIGQAIDGIFYPFALIDDLFEWIGSWFDDTEVTAGQANDAYGNTQDIIDSAVRSWLGDDSFFGGLPEDARAAMDKLFGDLANNTRDIKAMQARDAGEKATGKAILVDFSEYPDGAFPTDKFNLSYPAGEPGATSQIIIDNGVAKWDKANNLNRTASIMAKPEFWTETGFQILRGTVGSAPEDNTDGGQPYFYAKARANAADTDYIWVRAWSVGSWLQYRGDMGYAIGGVEYTWITNVPLTWSMDMTFVCGVGINPYQYQVYSGGTLVKSWAEAMGEVPTYAELPTGYGPADAGKIWVVRADGRKYTWSGTAWPANNGTAPLASKFDSDHLGWGSKTTLCRDNSGVPNAPGTVRAAAVADNELPTVTGTQAMYYRTSTTDVQLTGGSTITPVPNNFFPVPGRQSRDVLFNPTTGTYTVTKEGGYLVNGRIKLASNYSASICLVVLVNGNVAEWGEVVYPNNSANQNLSGHWMLDLKPNDTVRLATWSNGLTVKGLTGEATGAQSYFDIGKVI